MKMCVEQWSKLFQIKSLLFNKLTVHLTAFFFVSLGHISFLILFAWFLLAIPLYCYRETLVKFLFTFVFFFVQKRKGNESLLKLGLINCCIYMLFFFFLVEEPRDSIILALFMFVLKLLSVGWSALWLQLHHNCAWHQAWMAALCTARPASVNHSWWCTVMAHSWAWPQHSARC